jgi:hypothetical protein
VISLKDLWQQQRQQRQQEIAQRQQDVARHQQQVRDDLAQMQQERSAKASELHLSLKQFQHDLQQETQSYLSHISEQRRQQAQVLVANLQQFAEALQVQTHQFLSLTRADRQLRAEELFRNLMLFHLELGVSVLSLRKNLQAEIEYLRQDVQTICADTQTYLSNRQQERIQEQIQLAETLGAYVQGLQAKVGDYLAQLNQLGQERAQELNQQFNDQRNARAAEMEGLFEDLAIFRGELREYCSTLHAMVWGGGEYNDRPDPVVSPFMPKPETPTRRTPTTNGRTTAPSQPVSSMPRTSPRPSVPSAPVSRSVAAPVSAPVTTPSTAPVSSASSSSVAVAEPVAAPRTAPSATAVLSDEPPPALVTPDTSIDTFADSVIENKTNGSSTVEMSWGTAPITPSRKELADVEREIIGYLQNGEGARLTEIESALDINRFQAVDALRSLIKQGRVTQRDRVYVIQEESNS